MPFLSGVGRALAHRNYRLFIAGQSISLIGTWMQGIGLSWLVYDLTKSAFMLGVVSFSSQLPTLFVAPLAGVLSDRWNRHRTLLVTQSVAMLQAVLLVGLMWRGQIQIWQIIALGVVLGVVNAFDMPTRQAFLTDMVPNRDDLPNAIAVNSSIVNSARLIGPFLAGLLIAAGGAISCFLVNAVSYVPVLGALIAMRDLPVRPTTHTNTIREGLVEGFRYGFGFRPIRVLLSMMSLVSLAGISLSVLLPVFANDILKGGPMLFGMLTGASGCGALTSALYLASRKSVLGLGSKMCWATATFGVAIIGFGFSRSIPLSLFLLFISGFSMMLQMAACNTLLQTIAEESKRGRVMSLYTMAFMGTAPVGSLLAGVIADRYGAPFALLAGGLSCIAGAIVFARQLPLLRAQVRPIYEQAGILAPVAVAVNAVAQLETPPEEPG
ncbi:MAG: putative multidrug-efflux transporter [Planctomycetaceae bacterium]|nr:putative multidrug-efflux transporter [Planctomycetaceae bacterium]